MAWYKTGRVTVTNGSTAVTATGAKFASNVRVGDGFRAPDGRWYEVVNIASETTLGIYPAYIGITEAESPNWMTAPIQGYNKETADRLRAITDSIRDFTAEIEAAREAADRSKASADEAKISEDNAKISETNAKTSETNSKTSETNAKDSENVAVAAKDQAVLSETNAKNSENEAKASELAAKASEIAAGDSETAAKNSEIAAKASEVAAKVSENAAKVSENNAKTSETNAGESASTASTDSQTATAAKDAALLAQTRAEKARDDAIAAAGTVTGNLLDMGSWDASSNVYPTKPAVSAFWKVVGNGSGTDNGVTIEYGIGDTLVWSKPIEEFYKIDNTESVSSVNGHTGVVVLNKADVGLPNVDNTSDVNKPISNAQAAVNALKFDKSDVINNVTTNDAAKALSAAQGKYLYDLLQANNATIVNYTYDIATGGTTVSGADKNGVVLSYVPGTNMIVSLNGLLLWKTDYVALDGTSIRLVKATEAASELSVTVFGAFSVANHYTKAEEDALLQNVAAQAAAQLSTLDNAAYKRSNAVGTVSQSAGVPTGAIIESGSNSAGQYTKWADGTYHCTRTETLVQSMQSAIGALYWKGTSDNPQLGLPSGNFTRIDSCNASCGGEYPTITACVTPAGPGNFGIWRQYSPVSLPIATYTVKYEIWGRWF